MIRLALLFLLALCGVASAQNGSAVVTPYSLPAATSSTLGGVKPDGTTITNSSGAISTTYGTAANTAAQGNDARLGAGAVTGAIKSNGSNSFAQAATTDLSDVSSSSWTPALVAGTTAGTPAYSIQVGSYIKIGKLVIAWFNIALSGWAGSPSGVLAISGLPFTSTSTTNDDGSGLISAYTVSDLATSNYGITAVVGPNSTAAYLYSNALGGSGGGVTAAQAGTTPQFTGVIFYHM